MKREYSAGRRRFRKFSAKYYVKQLRIFPIVIRHLFEVILHFELKFSGKKKQNISSSIDRWGFYGILFKYIFWMREIIEFHSIKTKRRAFTSNWMLLFDWNPFIRSGLFQLIYRLHWTRTIDIFSLISSFIFFFWFFHNEHWRLNNTKNV